MLIPIFSGNLYFPIVRRETCLMYRVLKWLCLLRYFISYLTTNNRLPKLLQNLLVLSLIQSYLLILNCIKIYSDSVDRKSSALPTHDNDFCLSSFILSWFLFIRWRKVTTINTKQLSDSCSKLREKHIDVVQVPFLAKLLHNLASGRVVCHVSSILVRIPWW